MGTNAYMGCSQDFCILLNGVAKIVQATIRLQVSNVEKCYMCNRLTQTFSCFPSPLSCVNFSQENSYAQDLSHIQSFVLSNFEVVLNPISKFLKSFPLSSATNTFEALKVDFTHSDRRDDHSQHLSTDEAEDLTSNQSRFTSNNHRKTHNNHEAPSRKYSTYESAFFNASHYIKSHGSFSPGKRFLCSSNSINDKGITSAIPSSENVSAKLKQSLSSKSKEKSVPANKVSRLVNYGSLIASLGVGAIAEVTRRSLGITSMQTDGATLSKSPFLSNANAERIVQTLCKVRGAALKLGQMLSIQDSSVLDPIVADIFERVRQSADFMPTLQMEKVISDELGQNWRDRFSHFEQKPFAAASIGQVHAAKLMDGTDVAVKVQYPGVAESIDSDIDNLVAILKYLDFLPKGLYADHTLNIFREELHSEVDYEREAQASEFFRTHLLKGDTRYLLPRVFQEHSTKRILTSTLINGISLDKCITLSQDVRNSICKNILDLVLKELFVFHYMQTDPNWSNFMYMEETGQVALLDFGASRSYKKWFVDNYICIIKGAALLDREAVYNYSKTIGFLTGYENKLFIDMHVDAIMILGEAFSRDETFDFASQTHTTKINEMIPVMLKYRLKPPPDEVFSLHRKMAGAFLLCAKLKANINCKQMFDQLYNAYKFSPAFSQA